MAALVPKQMLLRSNFQTCSKWHVFQTVRKAYSSLTHFSGIYFDDFGDPRKVLKLKSADLPPSLGTKQVLVKMLMAPINPSDINMIEGTYHIRPDLPAFVGNEGVGEIVEVGSAVEYLSVGNWVLPGRTAWGTWRNFAVSDESDLQKIDNDIPALSAATLSVNPCTAYRMLKDFVNLNDGDVVLQNGANSAVGQCVIQLAKNWGIQTINVVRDRPEADQASLEAHLKQLGATHVITESFFGSREMKNFLKELNISPKLAFNCVGGKSASEIVRNLAHNGVMVTYGGMSKKPVTVPTSALIFKEVKLLGYWNTQWNALHKTSPERKKMYDELCDMIRQCKFLPPASELVPMKNYQEAVSKAMEGFQGTKKVLVMDENFL